ncbi:uncharacterized protein MONOS_10233 [Monocercomonoides exilis]|uniref:uncharacterized protein n=1 Tax=Monocercomonoides exilis TaxID=2049356 RepID=UPI003559CABD|nr:hypothetical protein MONOS_10233 [Monocercomonoides exilis]|eukprot:MONOS_10233.1-p1 / transcript=MONOS_10233.1 / gene=MONOS_10233 / organism=Monocercomonoides_exilis_PA203 / gene_product=unspecified product / transcript_product=unspecified product / location=Mono_scaffold00456:36408-39136(+) / protein_length=887 / sequence_SO=supercontig / SO=protein_coding / is_pseudo=false
MDRTRGRGQQMQQRRQMQDHRGGSARRGQPKGRAKQMSLPKQQKQLQNMQQYSQIAQEQQMNAMMTKPKTIIRLQGAQQTAPTSMVAQQIIGSSRPQTPAQTFNPQQIEIPQGSQVRVESTPKQEPQKPEVISLNPSAKRSSRVISLTSGGMMGAMSGLRSRTIKIPQNEKDKEKEEGSTSQPSTFSTPEMQSASTGANLTSHDHTFISLSSPTVSSTNQMPNSPTNTQHLSNTPGSSFQQSSYSSQKTVISLGGSSAASSSSLAPTQPTPSSSFASSSINSPAIHSSPATLHQPQQQQQHQESNMLHQPFGQTESSFSAFTSQQNEGADTANPFQTATSSFLSSSNASSSSVASSSNAQIPANQTSSAFPQMAGISHQFYPHMQQHPQHHPQSHIQSQPHLQTHPQTKTQIQTQMQGQMQTVQQSSEVAPQAAIGVYPKQNTTAISSIPSTKHQIPPSSLSSSSSSLHTNQTSLHPSAQPSTLPQAQTGMSVGIVGAAATSIAFPTASSSSYSTPNTNTNKNANTDTNTNITPSITSSTAQSVKQTSLPLRQTQPKALPKQPLRLRNAAGQRRALQKGANGQQFVRLNSSSSSSSSSVAAAPSTTNTTNTGTTLQTTTITPSSASSISSSSSSISAENGQMKQLRSQQMMTNTNTTGGRNTQFAQPKNGGVEKKGGENEEDDDFDLESMLIDFEKDISAPNTTGQSSSSPSSSSSSLSASSLSSSSSSLTSSSSFANAFHPNEESTGERQQSSQQSFGESGQFTATPLSNTEFAEMEHEIEAIDQLLMAAGVKNIQTQSSPSTSSSSSSSSSSFSISSSSSSPLSIHTTPTKSVDEQFEELYSQFQVLYQIFDTQTSNQNFLSSSTSSSSFTSSTHSVSEIAAHS